MGEPANSPGSSVTARKPTKSDKVRTSGRVGVPIHYVHHSFRHELNVLSGWVHRRFPFSVRLAVLLVFGAAVQGYVALTAWMTPDEGNYLSAAFATAQGGIPLVTFPARDPGLIYYLAVGCWLFGPSLEVAVGQIILLNLGTALLLALIARRWVKGRGEQAALVTAGMFLLNPFDVHVGTELLMEPVATFFLTCGAFLLLREVQDRSWKLVVLGGVFLGAATLTRQDAAVVAVPLLLFLWWTRSGWRHRLRETLLYLLPGILLVAALALFVWSRTSLVWLIEELWLNPTNTNMQSPFLDRMGLIPYAWLAGGALFLVPMVLSVLAWRTHHRYRVSALLLGAGLTLLVLGILATYPYIVDDQLGPYGAVIQDTHTLFSGYLWLVAAVLLGWLCALGMTIVKNPIHVPASLPVLGAVAGWGVFFIGGDLNARDFASSVYFYDAAAPASLLFGIWVTTVFPLHPAHLEHDELPAVSGTSEPGPPRPRSRTFMPPWASAALLAFVIVLASTLSAVLLLGSTNAINAPAENDLPVTDFPVVSLSVVHQVSSWIEHNVPKSATMFSVDDIYLVEAKRLSTPVLNIASSPYFRYSYPSNQSPYPEDPFGLMPSARQLLQLWNETDLSWVVEGSRTLSMSGHQALVGWYFDTEFHPVISFGLLANGNYVEILERGSVPGTQRIPSLLGWAGLKSPTSAVYVEPAGEFYLAGPAIPYLWSISTVGSRSDVRLPGISGVTQLSTGNGLIWMIPTNPSKIGVYDPNSGNFSTFSTPKVQPSFILADNRTNVSYVLAGSSHQVISFDSHGKERWALPLGCSPTTATLVQGTNSLLVVCKLSAQAYLLDTTTGNPIRFPIMDLGLLQVASVPGEIVGVDTRGGLYLWNATSWTLVASRPGVSVFPPIVPIEDGKDVLVYTAGNSGNDLLEAYDTVGLAFVGHFFGQSNPSAGAWSDQGGGLLLQTSNSTGSAQLGTLPDPTYTTLYAPAGASVSWQDMSLPVGVTVNLWPGSYEFSVNKTGFVTSQQVATVFPGEAHVGVPLFLGQNLSGLQTQQRWFLVEVLGVSVIAYFALLALILPDETSPPSPPDRSSVTPSPKSEP